jgi:hypothetical protein
MFLKKKSAAFNNRATTPLTEKSLKDAHLVREAWWLVLVLVGWYLAAFLIR